MSKGSPIVALRVPQEMLDILKVELVSVNQNKVGLKYDLSLFILTAVAEKLCHLERGRKKGRSAPEKRDAPSDLGVFSEAPARSLLRLLRERARIRHEENERARKYKLGPTQFPLEPKE